MEWKWEQNGDNENFLIAKGEGLELKILGYLGCEGPLDIAYWYVFDKKQNIQISSGSNNYYKTIRGAKAKAERVAEQWLKGRP